MEDELINKAKLLEDIEDAIDIENDGEDVEKSKFIILGLKIAKKYINKAATVEAITRERYHEMTERFFDEFVDNGANKETVATISCLSLSLTLWSMFVI